MDPAPGVIELSRLKKMWLFASPYEVSVWIGPRPLNLVAEYSSSFHSEVLAIECTKCTR